MTRLLPLLAVLVLPLFGSGCTVFVWQEATRAYNDGGHVYTTTERDGVLRPVAWYDGSEHFAMPLDCDGRINGPVVYTGDARTAAAIAADLTDVQRATLLSYRFSAKDRVAYSDLKWDRDRPGSGWVTLEIREARCLAMAVDSDGNPLPVIDGKGRVPARLADDARIVLVPDRQPRSPGDRTGAVISAAVLTPFTLAGDVLLSPLWLAVTITNPSWLDR